jgi:hypothetical protein
MSGGVHGEQSKELPADLSRAGEARHFISWRAAVAGLGSGALTQLATAAEAALTDIYLSAEKGNIRIEARGSRLDFRVEIQHPELPEESRRMRNLSGVLERFVDGYEISATRTVLVKRLPQGPQHSGS